jgi:predicted transcriptional regulator
MMTLELDDETTGLMNQLIQREPMDAAQLVKKALANYLNSLKAETNEIKAQFKQEALDSWSEYQETGLHLTNKEIGDWLNTWGTDNERELPLCHK